MIVIKITPTDGKERLFTDHHQVCNYIKNIEKQKILEPGAKKIWSFIRHRYETFYSLYYRNPSFKDFLTQKEKEAVEKEMGLLEIVKGNSEDTTQILFTPDLDIEPLKRDWSKKYCIEHGFTYSEFVLKN
jgi:hypothetical protein